MARDKTVILKLTDEELKRIRGEAEKLGIPMTGFIRLLLNQYFDGIRFERDKVVQPEKRR